MFTGIIESQGTIKDIRQHGTNKTFVIHSPISKELKVDQSISHDGVCLTVEHCDQNAHEITMIKETLDCTNLGDKKIGDILNLERCLKISDRLDGHMVQGHVDTSVKCLKKIDQGGSWDFHFSLPQKYESLVVMKGSICINGISLTVSKLEPGVFGVSIIPYTFDETNMSQVNLNDMVNIEFDILGKYVQRQLDTRTNG